MHSHQPEMAFVQQFKQVSLLSHLEANPVILHYQKDLMVVQFTPQTNSPRPGVAEGVITGLPDDPIQVCLEIRIEARIVHAKKVPSSLQNSNQKQYKCLYRKYTCLFKF
jgi:hypothetical protein